MEPSNRANRGQVVVIFAFAAVVLIAMVGLVLDGGATFGQRRIQQNGADLAALAGANAWLLDPGDAASKAAAATAMAEAVAAQNGYLSGANSAIVTVDPQPYGAAGAESVRVQIEAKHQNAFGSIIGLQTWDVSVTATAVVGPGGSAHGVAPIAFLKSIFVNGTDEILPLYSDRDHPYAFGETNGDYPTAPGDIAWTLFASPANLNTSDTRAVINGTDELSRSVNFGDYIGQHNNGNHTALYGDVHDYLAGQTLTVPVVDASGHFMGWSLFHVVDAAGGSQKTVTGYFTTGFSEDLDVYTGSGTPPVAFGGLKVLKLIN